MKTEALLSMLESVTAQHLDYLPSLLKQGKRDLVIACLDLLSGLQTSKYDEILDNRDFFLDFISNCMQVIRVRPHSERLDFLIKGFLGSSVSQQREILKLLPIFKDKKTIGTFLCTEYQNLSGVLAKEVLTCLSALQRNDYGKFVLDNVRKSGFSLSEQCEILENMFLVNTNFDTEFTTLLKELLRTELHEELRTSFFKLLSLGDQNIALPIFAEALPTAKDTLLCIVLDGLMKWKKFDMIDLKIIDHQSQSRFFPLAAKIAEVYSVIGTANSVTGTAKSQKSFFSKGLTIISRLLNENSREAKLSAISAAEFFRTDNRVADWIGSLLFSESEVELFDRILDFLQKCEEQILKPLLVKACERGSSDLSIKSLTLLARFRFPDLFDFMLDFAKKKAANYPQVAAAAVQALSSSIPEGRETDVIQFLDSDDVDLQRAAIRGLTKMKPELACKFLEQKYQNFSGLSLVIAELVLFQKGAPYILDDLLMMLSRENSSEQRVAIHTLAEIFFWIRQVEPTEIELDVINNIQVWCREIETRAKAAQSFYDDFDLSLLYELRQLSLANNYEAMQKKAVLLHNAHPDNFFLQVAVMYGNHCLGEEIVSESGFQILSKADDFILIHACLNDWHKRRGQKKEFLLNQLHTMEVMHNYYGEVLRIVSSIPRANLDSPVFINLLKIVQNASLPHDATLHTMFAQILIKFRKYEQAFRQLLFGFFTNAGRNYMLELATSALKCGYITKAEKICQFGMQETHLSDTQKENLDRLHGKIQDILAIRGE